MLFILLHYLVYIWAPAYMTGAYSRSKIESDKSKFYGQLLASFVNRIGDFYNFCKQLTGDLEAFPQEILNFSSSEMVF